METYHNPNFKVVEFDHFTNWHVNLGAFPGWIGGHTGCSELSADRYLILSNRSLRYIVITLHRVWWLERDYIDALSLPPRVEYSVTDFGKTLFPHVEALIKWVQENFEQIMINQQKSN